MDPARAAGGDSPRTPAAARGLAERAMRGVSGRSGEPPSSDGSRSGISWRGWNTGPPTAGEERALGRCPTRRSTGRKSDGCCSSGGAPLESLRGSREDPDPESPPALPDDAHGALEGAAAAQAGGDRPDLLPQGSMKSIMQGVRERMERLEGSPAARSARRAKTSAAQSTAARSPSGCCDTRCDVSRAPEEASRLPSGPSAMWRRFRTGTGRSRARSVPFRVALLCPIVSMMLACLGTFVPLVGFTKVTQQDIFAAYDASLDDQSMLIYRTAEQATQWLFTQVLLNMDKEVFVGLIEPADRAVDTLGGAIEAQQFSTTYYSNGDEERYPLFNTPTESGGGSVRREIMQRAWQELQNQWSCQEQTNKLCSGRVDSLYAAVVTEQYVGASFRERNGSTEKKVHRAQGGTEPGAVTELWSWTTQMTWGDECDRTAIENCDDGTRARDRTAIENYSSVGEPWFTAQSTEAAKWAGAEGANASGALKKFWSELYFMSPWTPGSDDGSGQLGMSWTRPIAYCGDYSCFTGVVSADLTLDRVDAILEQQWAGLRRDLGAEPWSYELLPNTSSLFIVNLASPRFPGQEGVLIGSSGDGGDESSPQPGELTPANESKNEVVALAARAVLERYGSSWASVTEPDQSRAEGEEVPQPFYFSKSKLLSTGKLDSQACTPLEASKSPAEDPRAPDCYQVALKTMKLDEKLEWLMVVVLPSAAFRSQSRIITEIQGDAQAAKTRASTNTDELMAWALVLSGVIGAVSLSMTVGFSFLVLRPLNRLGVLMRRLGQLDFAHESREFRRLHKGVKGFVAEVNDLQDGFCRLSKSIEIFARFVPETVVRGLVRGEDRKLRPYVDPRNVTIMFSDIRDFTTISEQLSQDDLCFVLYLYLNTMIEIIESEGGVVAEVLGDGLLAFWNTPDNVRSHEAKACNAALRQQEQLTILNAKLADQGLPQLAIRIGIHTGQVLTGNLGSESKMKFGCMGDPVNLASRLEGLCKMYGIGVMISEATYQALPSTFGFACRRLDLVQVKGKKEPTMIYELMGRDIQSQAGTTDELEQSLGVEPCRRAQAATYERALQAYQQARFQEAAQIAGELPESDVAGQKLLERVRGYLGWRGTSLSREELANWTGVVGMTDK